MTNTVAVCEKCSAIVPSEYINGDSNDDWWIECKHNGWYCPKHSPTSNCEDCDCECCNPY